MRYGAWGTSLLSSAVGCSWISRFVKTATKNKIKKEQKRKHCPGTGALPGTWLSGQSGNQRFCHAPLTAAAPLASLVQLCFLSLPEQPPERVAYRPHFTDWVTKARRGEAARSATHLPPADLESRTRAVDPTGRSFPATPTAGLWARIMVKPQFP